MMVMIKLLIFVAFEGIRVNGMPHSIGYVRPSEVVEVVWVFTIILFMSISVTTLQIGGAKWVSMKEISQQRQQKSQKFQ
jgi:hypothetical protein